MMEPVQFLRQFLAVRPVSADMDRWVQYWSKWDHAAKNHEVRTEFYLPDFRDSDTPLVAADLFQWDRASRKTFGKHEVMSIQNIPGNNVVGDRSAMDKRGFRRGYHGTSLFAL